MLSQFSVPGLALLGLLTVCFLVQLWFLFAVHRKLIAHKIAELPETASTPISVIICARNERENLEKYLPSVLMQDYPDFEVVVVNDRSWDGTADLLEEMALQYKQLKVVTVNEGEKFIAGKKFAVTMGIKAASHNWLVFSDADCEPATPDWLRGMQPGTEETEILLGYSPYLKHFGLLNALIRFETFFTAVNYLSFTLRGMPYMGVGRNMAYRKALFFKSKGFAAHMHIPSGDDDLFVNANGNSANTTIMVHKATHVWSEPKTSWIAYLRQKKRHFGAGKFYKPKHKFILSLQIITQFLFYASAVALCFMPDTLYFAIGTLVFSIILRSTIYPTLLCRLNYRELRWWFPVLDVLLFVFLVVNALLSIFIKRVKWK